MNAVSNFEDHFLNAVTAVVMAPVAALYALFWFIEEAGKAIAPYSKHISFTLAFVALCVTFPMLPVGLAIVAALGWATYPRAPRNGGWDSRKSGVRHAATI